MTVYTYLQTEFYVAGLNISKLDAGKVNTVRQVNVDSIHYKNLPYSNSTTKNKHIVEKANI